MKIQFGKGITVSEVVKDTDKKGNDNWGERCLSVANQAAEEEKDTFNKIKDLTTIEIGARYKDDIDPLFAPLLEKYAPNGLSQVELLDKVVDEISDRTQGASINIDAEPETRVFVSASEEEAGAPGEPYSKNFFKRLFNQALTMLQERDLA